MKWIVDDRDGYKVACSECGREYIKMRRCPYCKGNTDRPEQGRLGEGLR